MLSRPARHFSWYSAGFFSQFDNYLFDCDGVLWHGNRLLPGVEGMLKRLRDNDKKVYFFTNNAGKSRLDLQKKFESLGIKAGQEECYTSAYASALYLQSIGFPQSGKKAFVVGMSALREELEQAGIQVLSKLEPAPSLDPAVGAVVAGLDTGFSYDKLREACLILRYQPGALFVATNTDAARNESDGRLHPGAGTIVHSIEVGSGRTPTVVGKPNTLLLRVLEKERGLDASRSIMVGDRLDTDIAFGLQGGMATMLMMTGVTSPDMLQESTFKPTFVCDSFDDLQ